MTESEESFGHPLFAENGCKIPFFLDLMFVMKRIAFIFLLLSVAAGCTKGYTSLPGKDNYGGNAAANFPSSAIEDIVTVKQDEDGTVYFQLDDKTILYPVDYDEPFTGIKRIVCGINIHKDNIHCSVFWYTDIEQGLFVDDFAEDPDLPSPDGINIVEDWTTTVEDGFLTVHYEAWWGDGSVPHTLKLVQDPDQPYSLTLLHYSNGDEKIWQAQGLVYFDINPLPPTGDQYVTITLNWTNIEGKASSKTYPFRSRQ